MVLSMKKSGIISSFISMIRRPSGKIILVIATLKSPKTYRILATMNTVTTQIKHSKLFSEVRIFLAVLIFRNTLGDNTTPRSLSLKNVNGRAMNVPAILEIGKSGVRSFLEKIVRTSFAKTFGTYGIFALSENLRCGFRVAKIYVVSFRLISAV